MKRRAGPLTSHEVIVNTIAATTTRTGLTVSAELDTGDYPKGIKISDREIQNLEKQNVLRRHDFHGEWNLCAIGHKFHYARLGIMSVLAGGPGPGGRIGACLSGIITGCQGRRAAGLMPGSVPAFRPP